MTVKNVETMTSADVSNYVGSASGKLGFLKWVEATFPAVIAGPVIKAAALEQIKARGTALGRLGRFGSAHGLGLIRKGNRVAGIGAFGDASTDSSGDVTTVDTSSLSTLYLDPNTYGTTAAPAAATAVATSAPASDSWVSSIGSALSTAISAAGQAYLTVTQTDAQKSLVALNLQRAQQGLPPISYTAAQLGATGPSLNLGVSSTTLTPILWLVGGIAAIALVMKALGGRARA